MTAGNARRQPPGLQGPSSSSLNLLPQDSQQLPNDDCLNLDEDKPCRSKLIAWMIHDLLLVLTLLGKALTQKLFFCSVAQ